VDEFAAGSLLQLFKRNAYGPDASPVLVDDDLDSFCFRAVQLNLRLFISNIILLIIGASFLFVVTSLAGGLFLHLNLGGAQDQIVNALIATHDVALDLTFGDNFALI
jgi:hypothetical protein